MSKLQKKNKVETVTRRDEAGHIPFLHSVGKTFCAHIAKLSNRVSRPIHVLCDLLLETDARHNSRIKSRSSPLLISPEHAMSFFCSLAIVQVRTTISTYYRIKLFRRHSKIEMGHVRVSTMDCASTLFSNWQQHCCTSQNNKPPGKTIQMANNLCPPSLLPSTTRPCSAGKRVC